jgi:uncharacterized protein YjcR
MNTKDNKHTLWELSKSFFVKGMKRDAIIEMFERKLLEIDDACSGDLIEKNKIFLAEFTKELHTIPIEEEIEVVLLEPGTTIESRLARMEAKMDEILALLNAFQKLPP